MSECVILKKCVFTARLNADTSVMFLIATGRAFHSRGPATEKALSPNCVLLRGMWNSPVFVDLSLPRPEIVEILIELEQEALWNFAPVQLMMEYPRRALCRTFSSVFVRGRRCSWYFEVCPLLECYLPSNSCNSRRGWRWTSVRCRFRVKWASFTSQLKENLPLTMDACFSGQ